MYSCALCGARTLGTGTFNRAILTDEGDVLRIGNIDDEQTREDIMRGVAVTHLLQQFKSKLGPSLLIETVAGREISRLDPVFSRYSAFLKELRGRRFFGQRIEYLDGGEIPRPETSPEALAFPLLWFLVAARQHLFFAHNDFKPENIVFRNYDHVHSFTFELQGIGQYRIRAQQIPVVIDFDFASVFVTQDKSAAGTRYTQPPEVLQTMFSVTLEEAFPRDVGEHDDYWSLGMVLYYWWTGSVKSKDWPDFDAYVNSELVDRSGLDSYWGVPALEQYGKAFCIVRQLGGTTTETSPELVKAATEYNRLNPIMLNAFQTKLLRRLLSWDPKDRHYGGQPWKLITEHFSKLPLAAGIPDFTVSPAFRLGPETDEQRAMDRDYERLKLRIDYNNDSTTQCPQ